MAKLDGDFKKLKRGEFLGTAATLFCAAVTVYFIVGFTIARVYSLEKLQLVTFIISPILIVIGAALAAFCNIRFGGAIDRAINKYVVDQFVDNAALMHPEKNSLKFLITLNGDTVELSANGGKEQVVFDFSPLGKLTLMRKNTVLNSIETTLCKTFCRLFERGTRYSEVSYIESEVTRKKSGKTIYIIKDGTPEKRTYRNYIKNK